jgi:hypothetical protein
MVLDEVEALMKDPYEFAKTPSSNAMKPGRLPWAQYQ